MSGDVVVLRRIDILQKYNLATALALDRDRAFAETLSADRQFRPFGQLDEESASVFLFRTDQLSRAVISFQSVTFADGCMRLTFQGQVTATG